MYTMNDAIVKTYSGKCGCTCGCLGKYSYTEEGAAHHGPGYDVSDKVNARSVKIIAKKVLNNPEVQWQDNIAYFEDRKANKLQMVVFVEKK